MSRTHLSQVVLGQKSPPGTSGARCCSPAPAPHAGSRPRGSGANGSFASPRPGRHCSDPFFPVTAIARPVGCSAGPAPAAGARRGRGRAARGEPAGRGRGRAERGGASPPACRWAPCASSRTAGSCPGCAPAAPCPAAPPAPGPSPSAGSARAARGRGRRRRAAAPAAPRRRPAAPAPPPGPAPGRRPRAAPCRRRCPPPPVLTRRRAGAGTAPTWPCAPPPLRCAPRARPAAAAAGRGAPPPPAPAPRRRAPAAHRHRHGHCRRRSHRQRHRARAARGKPGPAGPGCRGQVSHLLPQAQAKNPPKTSGKPRECTWHPWGAQRVLARCPLPPSSSRALSVARAALGIFVLSSSPRRADYSFQQPPGLAFNFRLFGMFSGNICPKGTLGERWEL